MIVSKRISFLILIVIVFSWPAFGQDEDEKPKVELPDKVMSQVVRRIVQWYFKPANQPRKIHFSENGIKATWMPKIRNIEFVLLNERDSSEREKGVYLFESLEQQGKTYSINFGFGEPTCNRAGETWKFRVNGDNVRLWQDRGGWGWMCSSDSFPPASNVGDPSPNELAGYEFFAKGKLNGLRLGYSGRDHIESLFGSNCEKTCSYDERWDLQAAYYGEHEVYSTTATENGVETKTSYWPRSRYYGTISSITLRPKESLSFSTVVFPRTFNEAWGSSIGDSFTEKGFQGAVHTQSRSYTDGYGLTYEVFENITFINLPNNNRLKEGDLLSIEYKVPDTLERSNVLIRKNAP